MPEDKHDRKREIEPGMNIKATGDLGEGDMSAPRVVEVHRSVFGDVLGIKIRKGIFFRKELEIPIDRIQEVERDAESQDSDCVVIAVSEQEIAGLSATGVEQLTHETNEQAQETMPTVEGLGEKEQVNLLPASHGMHAQVESQTQESRARKTTLQSWLHILGPGLLAGLAGNDASAVAAYSIDGATVGLGHLWLLLLSTPLYYATQFACAQIGRVTHKGLPELLHEHYGRTLTWGACILLIIANIALITADLVAVGSGIGILSGPLHIAWWWFVVPVAVVLWYLTVYQNFGSIKKIFLVLSILFVVYLITAFIARPNWALVLTNSFIPHSGTDFVAVSSAVALLGATISPYNIFWQVQGEKEEDRPGQHMKEQLRFAALDVGLGVVSGNLISYFIILCTATTLFTHHQHITTAADAAMALVPVLGPLAETLFALGLIGAGIVAIPILLASTSYAISGSFGWPTGLSKKLWQDEGFYIIITVALLCSVLIAFLRIDPIQLLFWANVLSGVLAPILVSLLILIGRNRKIMHEQRLGWLTFGGLIITTLVMIAASALLFFGLLTK